MQIKIVKQIILKTKTHAVTFEKTLVRANLTRITSPSNLTQKWLRLTFSWPFEQQAQGSPHLQDGSRLTFSNISFYLLP